MRDNIILLTPGDSIWFVCADCIWRFYCFFDVLNKFSGDGIFFRSIIFQSECSFTLYSTVYKTWGCACLCLCAFMCLYIYISFTSMWTRFAWLYKFKREQIQIQPSKWKSHSIIGLCWLNIEIEKGSQKKWRGW